MEEIKRRQIAIDEILYERKTTSFKYTNTEFVALQFRKIFELVILASLASHQHLFEGIARKLAKEWQVTKIVAIVKNKNPGILSDPNRSSTIRERNCEGRMEADRSWLLNA